MPESLQPAKLIDVARHAGVGIATVSRALNGTGRVSEASRRRILKAVAELNYKPNRSAQALKGGRSGMVGMVIPRMADRFFASCVDAVEAVSMKNGSLLVVAASHDRTDQTMGAIRQLLDHKVDGLVLATSEYLSPAMVRNLRALPVPAVGIDAPLTPAGLPSVLIANAESAALATTHLVEHGFTRIVSVQVNPRLLTMKERLRGYESAMQKAGLQPVQHPITDRAAAEDLIRAYRDTPGRYAFVAGNETAAKYLVAATKHLGMRMPDDFGMVSFDDFDLADSMETPLTVMRQPVERIGTTAANVLFHRLKQPGSEATSAELETVLAAELVVRRSCGCTG